MAEVMNIAEVPKRSNSAIYYNNKIKTDAEFYEKERKRVSEYIHNRYFNDPEYRERILKQKKEYYLKKKELKKSLNTAE
jgi:hypothetical protein